MYHLGIDVGGTFTDVAVVRDNEVAMFKTPTVPKDPAESIRAGLEQAAEFANTDVQSLLADTEKFVHGTTVATNSVIQYRGATTALLTTRGFRDSLEMRRCHRAGQWDFFTPQPPLIVPRYLRRGIDERVLYDGTVDTPLDEAQLMEEVDDLVGNHRVEAIGICFLFSFKNTAHEARAAELIRARYPDVFVSASHEISPQIREYERTCTTVINAFVGPVLSRYLSNLGKFLADNRLAHEYQVIQSNGGVTAASAAGQHGARALLSGPAGGAIGGLMLAKAVGRENLIVADMGGTSFDLTLIQEKELQLVAETEIAGYTISLPMIGIHTIGAGGGSIGHIDDSGLLKVGPRSAGSLPGPACYARGGTEPTVTDANLVLGFLSPSYFLGGAMPLDTDLARQAIKQHVADPFGLTVEEGAQAIFEIVNSNMVDAIHVVTVQKGYDPREYALVAAGGAAPIHTGVLARALEISQVIVPKASSVFCAIGGLQADAKYDYISTFLSKASEIDVGELAEEFQDLVRQGVERLEQDAVPVENRFFEFSLDMRYIGQHWDIQVPAVMENDTPDLEAAVAEFHRRHNMLHGYQMLDRETEVVNCRLMAIGRTPGIDVPVKALGDADASMCLKGSRRAYFGTGSGFIDARVYDGERLVPGHRIEGPAIIERLNTTVILVPGDEALVDGQENILIQLD